MGRFDVDDLLRDLGDEDPDAPKEGPNGPLKDDAAPSPAPEPAPEPAAAKPAGAKPFRRKDPDETPRPPDFTSGGLGRELETDMASRDADPARLRPDDALSTIDLGLDDEDLAPTATGDGDDLIAALAARKVIDDEQVENARRVLKQSPGKSQADVVVESGVDEADVMRVVAELARLPFEQIDFDDPDAFDANRLMKLGLEYCEQNLVLPLRKEGRRLVVGTASPDDVFVLDEVKRQLGVSAIKHVLVTGFDIRGVIELQQESDAEEYDVENILADVDEDDVEVVEKQDDADDGVDDADSSPVVRLVNHIIQTALKEGASDIHIEPDEKDMKVRFRIDGILFEMMKPPRKMHAALTSRIKIMANLDIAERRLPQDGRIRVTVMNRQLDLRVSTVPTPKGEKTVMRILDNRAIKVTLDQLGFGEDTLTIWRNQIANPHGIILVTGPTGSGKTTTLYASLQQLDLKKLNISTVEDPVEYNLRNITQIQTHERIGMTFAKALKALLRQDPDVVMLGEIRDLETATIAIQASMTGHLVLSTLHTNDAPSSITRMINMGIEPFLAAAAVNAILAQRLVRRICVHCKTQGDLTDEVREFLEMQGIPPENLMKGAGCSKCRQTGYSGRQGLYELLVLDDHIRDLVARNPNVSEFRRACKERGMVTLREDGFQKVGNGITTIEEILRVTESTI